jgi:hypothetical protein
MNLSAPPIAPKQEASGSASGQVRKKSSLLPTPNSPQQAANAPVPVPAPARRPEPGAPGRGAGSDGARSGATQRPSVTISIGKVEIRSRAQAPSIEIHRVAPRAHQIDPGLEFGLGGNR